MKEKVKKTEQFLNNYIIDKNLEQTAVYHNLEFFYDLSSVLDTYLSKHVDTLKEEIYYSKITKMSLFDKLNLVEEFYKEHGIEFDLNKHLDDGTIDFIYYDHLNIKHEQFVMGRNYYEKSKKLIDVANHGFVVDILVLIHELSHLRDQPDIRRNQLSDLLTEALACAESLICADYLKELGYQEDMLLWKKRLYYTFYILAKQTKIKYEMLLLFKNLGSLSESSYELFYGNNDKYKDNIEHMNQFIDNNDFNIYFYSWYIMGAVFGTHLYNEHKNDPSFMKNIILLHDRINDSDIIQCLKLMNFNNDGSRDLEKVENALELTVSELVSNNKKYLVKKF